MKSPELTPEQWQLIEMLAIAAAGRHNVLITGSEQQIENAVRWVPKVQPVLNRDESEAVKTTWGNHAHRARPKPRRNAHRWFVCGPARRTTANRSSATASGPGSCTWATPDA